MTVRGEWRQCGVVTGDMRAQTDTGRLRTPARARGGERESSERLKARNLCYPAKLETTLTLTHHSRQKVNDFHSEELRAINLVSTFHFLNEISFCIRMLHL